MYSACLEYICTWWTLATESRQVCCAQSERKGMTRSRGRGETNLETAFVALTKGITA